MAEIAKEEVKKGTLDPLSAEDIRLRLAPINEKILGPLTTVYNYCQKGSKRVGSFELHGIIKGQVIELYLTTSTHTVLKVTCFNTKHHLNNSIEKLIADVMRRGINYYMRKLTSLPDELI